MRSPLCSREHRYSIASGAPEVSPIGPWCQQPKTVARSVLASCFLRHPNGQKEGHYCFHTIVMPFTQRPQQITLIIQCCAGASPATALSPGGRLIHRSRAATSAPGCVLASTSRSWVGDGSISETPRSTGWHMKPKRVSLLCTANARDMHCRQRMLMGAYTVTAGCLLPLFSLALCCLQACLKPATEGAPPPPICRSPRGCCHTGPLPLSGRSEATRMPHVCTAVAIHSRAATQPSLSWTACASVARTCTCCSGGQRLRGGLPTEAGREGGGVSPAADGGGGRCGAESGGFMGGQVRRASITLARCAATHPQKHRRLPKPPCCAGKTDQRHYPPICSLAQQLLPSCQAGAHGELADSRAGAGRSN
jgi:hypothetical protein